MSEPRSRDFHAPDAELLDTATGRVLWRRLHPARRAPEADIHALRSGQQGPYEMSYVIAHGYAAERSIEHP